MDIELIIKKYALQNAIKYEGKATSGAVLGKVFAEHPELKSKGKELSVKIAEMVNKINSLPLEEQREQLEVLAPELLEKKEKKERNIFEFLNIPEGKKIITAFPPGPEKFPHIGHAKACLLNFLLAQQYGGKFILRFEDTNPEKVEQQYYDAMLDNFAWLGVKWDSVVYASDFMDMFYKDAENLLRGGLAYVDRASQEQVRESREIGQSTPDRNNTPEQNLALWKTMQTAPEGSHIVRLKIDLKALNSTLRDPTILRIVEHPHARQKTKYRIWPTYDFQNAIMDSHSNIDIRVRSKEFEMRNELQRWIQEKLELKITKSFEFGRFNMVGVESSGRIIKQKVMSGEYHGWDDPRLTTLVALRRRGFTPEAIKNFVVSTGLSKAESTVTWDDLYVHNRRILDNIAPRYSAIFDGVKIHVSNAPEQDVELHLNPNERKGGRKFYVKDHFFISKKDFENMQDGEVVRLMDCLNMTKDGKVLFDSLEYEDFKGKGKKIINWLPAEGNAEIEVLMPDASIVKGIAESHVSHLKEGDIIQFERFGFCRLDKKEGMKFWYAHK